MSGYGCHFGNRFCGAFVYANDVILLATSLCSDKKLSDVCQLFAEEYDTLFNTGKTKLLYFTATSVDAPIIPSLLYKSLLLELS